MKYVNILFIVILFTCTSLTGTVIDMPKLARPDGIVIDAADIVINDGETIYIHNHKDYKLRKSFGKKGPGPREFIPSPAPWFPMLRVYLKPQSIFVNSVGKVLEFDRDGNYISEFKTSGPLNQFYPLEKKYIGLGNANEGQFRYHTFSIYDTAVIPPKKGKEIFRIKRPDQRGGKINPVVMGMIKNLIHRHVMGDRIFLPTPDGIVHVFDGSGKEVATIKPPYKPVPFTSADTKKYNHFFSNDSRFQEIFARDRDRIEYYDNYPLVKEYRVDADNLYIVTNRLVEGKYKTYVYDHAGKLRKTVLVPLENADLLEVYPFTIYKNRLYQIRYNEDDDEWRLHVIDLK